MKKRAFALLNFFALNILFFAIYLNFIHKDINTLPVVSAATNAAPKDLSTTTSKNAIAITEAQKTKADLVQN
jgi:hypothetical protein